MRPIGFVICCTDQSNLFTKGKIYPYFEIEGPYEDSDFRIKTKNNDGDFHYWLMCLELKSTNNHIFDFYHHPEFPKDTSQWTEEDWFNYHLKYG